MKNAPHCTAVGFRTAYTEKHEICTAWDNKREEQSNVYGIFCADSACVGCIHGSMHAEKHYLIYALQWDGEIKSRERCSETWKAIK